MQVEVTELEGLSRRLNVSLPAERVKKAYDERLQQVAKNVKLPGFRPGKIPMNVIEKRFGKVVLREVASELMQAGFQQAVADKKLKVAGSPEVKPGEITKDQDLAFEVLYESYPEIELADFSQATIEKHVAEVTPDDIDHNLTKLRRQHAHWHDVDRAAAKGDQLVIDFDGFIDGKPFPGSSGKKLTLELGAGQMIPGFEEGLIGVKANEERSLDVVFPSDYPVGHLVNQKATFNVKIHHVQEAELPEANDELARKVNAKLSNFEELKDNLKADMELELKNKLAAMLKDQVLDQLIDMNPVEPPQSMIEDEIKNLQAVTRQQMISQQGGGKDPEKIQLPRDPFLPQAKKRVILGLFVSEAVKKLGIKSDKSKVNEKINEMVLASGYHNPEEMVAWYHQNKKLMSEIETLVLEDQVVDKLFEQATVSEKKMTYQEAFAPKLSK